MGLGSRDYDVALSFAGEDRPYVEQVAAYLRDQGVKVFYDGFEQATLWGKNLYAHLSTVYKDKAHYTIVFLSEHYKKKLWTKHELESAQARAFTESSEYILPVRFDDTEIPGIQITTGYLDLRGMQPEALGNLILTKLSANSSSAFEILVSQGNRSKTRNGETGPWQNFHQMRVLVRSGRKVEVDIAKAERSEEKDVLEIFVLFGGHSYIISNMQEKLIDFTKSPFMDWLICEKVSWGLNCNVDGRRLVLCFPQLSDLLWLNNEFYTPPQLQHGPRSGTSDPADVYGFGFTLSEP